MSERTGHDALSRAIQFQDRRYGAFVPDLSGIRLAIACMEDEVRETRDAWREERRGDDHFVHTAEEALQVAAVAMRLFVAITTARHAALGLDEPPTDATSKHEARCVQRGEGRPRPSLCTCGMTDEEVAEALGMTLPPTETPKACPTCGGTRRVGKIGFLINVDPGMDCPDCGTGIDGGTPC